MKSLFGRPHPWLMQAVGGLVAFVIFVPIGVYFYLHIISTETAKTIATLAPPATSAASGPTTSAGSPTASTGGTTGNGQVVWADVHAIFAQPQHCVGCHIGNNLGGLNLDTYANAMKGGTGGGPVTGPVIKPGDAANSYMYQVLMGQQQPQMPLGRAPLNAAQLKTIHDWIQGGAKP
jgi:hypothetical protein